MIRLTSCFFALLLSCACAAWAQSFPAKPVHLVVAFPAGGTADLLARSVGDALVDTWRQPVIVENKPGAGAIIATAQVQRAAPDGYTLLMVAPSFVMNPMLNSEARWDPTKDFTPVVQLVTSPLVIATSPESPSRTLKDLIDKARANPVTVTIAAVGPNTQQHMIAEMLKLEAKVDWVYAPYNGGAPAVLAALGGHVDAVIANYSEVSAHIAGGRLRMLATGTRERLENLKDVPTLAELGYSLIDGTIWFGFVAPLGTPREVVQKIRTDMQKVVNLPSVRDKLVGQSLYPVPSPEPFETFLAAQSQRYGSLIRQAGLKQ